MINKLLTIAVLITFIGSTSPKKIGKTMFKTIKSQDAKAIEDLFLSKNDFLNMMQNMDPKPRQEQIDMMLENYDERKKRFLDTYFDDLKEHKISNMKVEDITYDYHIGRPGKDEKIKWPESKNHTPVYDSKSLTKIIYNIKLKDNNTLQFEMMNYKNEWKLINIMRPPYFITN